MIDFITIEPRFQAGWKPVDLSVHRLIPLGKRFGAELNLKLAELDLSMFSMLI